MTAARAGALLATALLAAGGLLGCGGDDRPPTTTTTTSATTTTAERPATTTRERPAAPRPPASWTASCPTPTPSPVYGCRAVRGRVIAIESVDPDGDGDLHVIAREELPEGGVTLPGISVLDVRKDLRPRRDPQRGELVTGAGPVFRGSFRQKQVQVDVFRIWRP
ncbi:hypothetical protein [Patulibacter defluvii]|uniref:hypothetical protein n=1 Tax=Patulibacter defluvii TaxID=3095358 RepID=UPI002A7564EA|nr:hypothetical protein [Patulibacter sp. DM4]